MSCMRWKYEGFIDQQNVSTQNIATPRSRQFQVLAGNERYASGKRSFNSRSSSLNSWLFGCRTCQKSVAIDIKLRVIHWSRFLPGGYELTKPLRIDSKGSRHEVFMPKPIDKNIYYQFTKRGILPTLRGCLPKGSEGAYMINLLWFCAKIHLVGSFLSGLFPRAIITA